ncbi:MAG: energy-coupling factor transporter transmembrane protein EcfT [Deltaproteobacteria bacterium]|nr:energy-coupling factor transporter transmembrane protein EcfT [Deltaproteobacteria bacterium]
MYNMGQYLSGDTIIHRLDPRIKILSVVALSVLILRGTWSDAAAVSVFVAILTVTASLRWGQIVDALRPVALFAVLIFLLHALFPEGSSSSTVPSFRMSVTAEGVLRGAFVSWQFVCLVLCAAVLTLTTSPAELVEGMERLLRPLERLRIPTHQLAMMVSLALRFMPVLLEELDRIKTAKRARGGDFQRGSVVGRARAAALLAIPLIAGAFRRADELAEALEARGYRHGPRTTLRELKMTALDRAALAVMVFFIAALEMLRSLEPKAAPYVYALFFG